MRCKPLVAVLLGLLMVGVTAGSAMAMSVQKEPIKPQNNIGLGSVVMTRLDSGSGAIISKHRQYIGTGAGYAWYYKVKHNGDGYLDVSVFKWIPLGGYTTAVIMPDMTTGSFYGYKFKLDSINTHSVLGHRFKIVVAEYSEWISIGGWWTLDVKFNAGYGRHGIVTIGFTSWPWFSEFLGAIGVTGAIKEGGKQLLKFISTGSANALSSAIALLLSGANIDALIFEEV
ncbi:hypothetical protein [Thermococcus thioreducens]|uniref:Uncharacterized protein n=1 Tax=Thermococcus thioreducens TaxID=277988 RepID=A0A0Q2S3H6_9EURY|nr:hypothetical protein [Thermococcus thioreducens]ASJ12660.1 hypothetical protein A3L14_07080 [Thermococcus thioreducens]KQH81995.1 hypothetical protein AMR53_07855 [Thermococcus thioreducens]SEV87098.1 hypothetical protein SAMN05216170_0532 [Thermococcus thioreducens]